MKSRIIKSTVLLLCLMFVMSALVGGATGCTLENYKEREVGDFSVRFFKDYCEIKGTTAQGNEKRFLTIPAYIDGVRVESLGVKGFTFKAHGLWQPEIISDCLEKVYFETTTKTHPYSFNKSLCPNLRKIIYPGMEDPSYALQREVLVYYPHSIFEDNWQAIVFKSLTFPANVSYYYNYEDANSVYYWIDDFDYGGTIDNIPTDPTRNGYTFGGWYKDAECSNKWDFETDTLPEEIAEWVDAFPEPIEETIYQETILYAKWI